MAALALMDEIARERLAQIAQLQHALEAAEPVLRYMRARKAELTNALVAKNDDEQRGRIKEINDLLELPERLQQEAVSLQQKPQEPAEYP